MYRVAIVGRPNVGKSTLFNRLAGSRKAIVGDEPGITRDRIYEVVRWHGRVFEILDTGGMIPDVKDVIPAKIFEQVEWAIEESDLLLLVVDGRAGITPADEQLMPVLRRSGKPLWVLVNKIDTPALEAHTSSFYALGAEELHAISAEHNRGISELLESVAARVEESETAGAEKEEEEISVAVVGRPNVGKSSLVNRLLGTPRAIVSEIPGTTRDSVDTVLLRDDIRFRIIDTAGIRRKGRTEERTEKVSVIIARKSLARADVALLLIDAEEGVTKLDAAIGGYAHESGCSIILVINKWDKIVKDQATIDLHSKALRRRLKYLAHAPILTVSALTGQRVSKLFEMIRQAREGRRLRIPTGMLNNLFAPEAARKWGESGSSHGFSIRYITQTGVDPPTFVVFTPGKTPLHFSTERYLVNQLRERFGFFAAPIRILQRVRK